MKELTPDIALEKHYEMWNAMARIENIERIKYDDDSFTFRKHFKNNWCKEKDENPVNNCYLCEYAFQAYLKEFERLNKLKQLNELKSDTNISISMENSMCKHCPILWNNNRENNDCEQHNINWTLSPIKDILALPINQEELDEYSRNNS